jgi:hypothetical protein
METLKFAESWGDVQDQQWDTLALDYPCKLTIDNLLYKSVSAFDSLPLLLTVSEHYMDCTQISKKWVRGTTEDRGGT